MTMPYHFNRTIKSTAECCLVRAIPVLDAVGTRAGAGSITSLSNNRSELPSGERSQRRFR